MPTSVAHESKLLSWTFWKTRRFLVGFLSFFGLINAYSLRANLTILVVTMTKNKTVLSDDGNITNVKEFDWDFKDQAYILSSFYYGFVLTQVPGGWLAAKYGGKSVFGLGIAVTAILTMFTPSATKISLYFLIAIRILQGICSGVIFPSYFGIASYWSPLLERNRFLGIPISGSTIGVIIGTLACAHLSETLGWESCYYIFGVIGLLWSVLWFLIVADSPAQDSRISDQELNYIQESLKNENVVQMFQAPWREIFKSPPLWGIITTHFIANWGILSICLQLPIYMNDIFNFEIETTGLVSVIPYIAFALISQFASILGDWIQIKQFLTTVQIRKSFICGGFLVQATCMLLITYMDTPIATVVFLTLSVGFAGFSACAFNVNLMDIAVNYASILKGVCSTWGHLPGILAPLLTGYLVTTGSKTEWNMVFYINTGMHLIGALLYGLLGSAKLEKWASKTENQPVEINQSECEIPSSNN